MSIKAIAKVWDYEGIDPRNKFILIAYADHADHGGCNVFPAVRTVSEKTCYSERTVQRATRELEEAGLLIPDGRGPRGTNKWRVNMEWGDNLTGCQSDRVTSSTERGDRVVTRTVLNHKTTVSEADTVEQAYACPDCGQICKSKGGLTNHRTRKHNVDSRHPAFKAYWEKASYIPVESVRQLIKDTVGDDPADVSFWGEVVGAYVALGWNPRNVSVMLDYFKKKELPGINNGRQKHPQHGRAGGGGAEKAAGSDAESDWFRQQREHLRKIPGSGVT